MTLTEIRDFIRLQLDEEDAAYYEDDDLDSYIELAARRFVNKTKCIVLKKSFTIDNDQVSTTSTVATEVFDITCIADYTTQSGLSGAVTSVATADNGNSSTFTDTAHGLNAGEWVTHTAFTESSYNGLFQITAVTTNTYTVAVAFVSTDTGNWAGAGTTIGDKYFKIYTKAGTEYLVWYDVDNGGSAPTGDNLIEVDISADDDSSTVASATATAISAITGFSATVDSNTVTVTLSTSGYVGYTHANVDVTNGGDTFSIEVTTSGIDAYYDIGYKIIKERGIIYIDNEDDPHVMNRIAWEDWNRLSSDEKSDYYSYVIDTRYNALYLPGFTSGTLYAEFFVHGESGDLEDYLENELIPAEYHETIANYALVLSFRRDKQFDVANRYLRLYIHDENEAKEEVGMRLTSSQAGDWSLDIINSHRDETNLLSNIYSI